MVPCAVRHLKHYPLKDGALTSSEGEEQNREDEEMAPKRLGGYIYILRKEEWNIYSTRRETIDLPIVPPPPESYWVKILVKLFFVCLAHARSYRKNVTF